MTRRYITILAFALFAASLACAQTARTFSVPTMTAHRGDVISLPILLDDTTEAIAIDLDIAYDPAVLEGLSMKLGSAAQGWELYYNIVPKNQRIYVAMFSVYPQPASSGAIVELTFGVLGGPGSVSPLVLVRHWINENWVPSVAGSGAVVVPTVTRIDDGTGIHKRLSIAVSD